MSAHSQKRGDKVKITFECSLEEKTYIKMLATKAHMTLGEFVLSYVKQDFPSKKRKPKNETMEAIKELRAGGGTIYQSMDDFWEDMGVDL